MKIHYINILLFELPLNILIYNQRNHNSTTPHTPKIPTTRLLCECDIYTSIYDNDPQMKAVMENYNRQTSDRFKEYDERMQGKRQKCREQCDKEIEKIILKDKLEKELMDKFATLQTDIQSDAIPTCICEKSLADKMEKGCLRCGGVLGGGVTPAWGLISGIVYTGWKTAALAAATKDAITKGLAAGEAAGAQAGKNAVMNVLVSDLSLSIEGVKELGTLIDATSYTNVPMITEALYSKFQGSCIPPLHVSDAASGSFRIADTDLTFCYSVWPTPLPGNSGSGTVSAKDTIRNIVNGIVADAETTAGATTKAATEEAIATLTAKNTGEVNATYASCQTVIIASIVAILVIVLVMIIIYLILRYRRKKKMKKKLQYIKLLEE
ncbi:hypothetical protein PFDG_00654 [Plasmodium falciparum Dd2]|uniref:Rifin n=1 Tax=Plasmodium falciparum (isolate Dd2) TaxID=57267 RepID=A0A0L7LY57_PLAF4|nr:hypothetical protein PFDG_00654 [Plasmodium falciparum Dd2]